MAILLTEFPVYPILITIGLLIWGYWVPKYQLAGTLTGILALILLISPILRAYSISRTLNQEISGAFNSNPDSSESAFSVMKMLAVRDNLAVISKNLIYTSYPEKDLALDFYPSAISGKRACIVVVHGGSWKSGDNKQLPELNAHLAKAGYHVAAINYRLAPKYKSPSAVEDVKKAIAFLKTQAGALQIDPGNFVLLGRSAGVQIALLAAYTLDDPAIKGVIDFYGPADMVWGYSVPSNPLVMNSRKVMEDYLGGTYSQVPQRYAESSPLNFASGTSVPTLIIHGENDVLVAYEHSIRLQKKLNKNGVKNYFLSLPWATHGFDYHIKGPGGQLSTYAVTQFLRHIL